MLQDTIATLTTETPVFTIQSGDETLFTPFFETVERVGATTFQRHSIFDGHLLKPVNTEALPIPELFNSWFFALLFFGFVMFAWLISFNVKRVGQMLGALWGHRGFSRFQREGDVFTEQLFFPLLLLVLLCLSLFGFRVGMLFGVWDMRDPETITTYGQMALGLGAVYLVRVIIIKIHAWVFKEQEMSKHYLLNIFVFNTSVAMVFLPLLLIAFFGDLWLQKIATYVMIFLFAVSYIWRAVRSFAVTIPVTKFSYVHNFLYLCTLEIGYYLLIYVLLTRVVTL